MNSLGTRLKAGTTIFEWLSEKGYATGLFTDNPYLTDLNTGLSNGFDVILNDKDPFPKGISPAAFVEQESTSRIDFLRTALGSDAPVQSILNGVTWSLKWHIPWLTAGAVFTRGDTYADYFSEWRASVSDRPWAACINLMDTHVPFRPTKEYDQWTTNDTRAARKSTDANDIDEGEEWKYALQQNNYDGTIRQADAVVEQIIEDLRATGELDNTLVVVTADHGEEFGDIDPITGDLSAGHGNGTTESLLRVPLVVQTPHQTEPKTVSEPVGLVDFPDVVRAAVDGDSPNFDTGRTVFAGGLADDHTVDIAYERHETCGVSKYVRINDTAWTVHVPTPQVNYLLSEGIPTNILEDMMSLSDVGIARDIDTTVSKAAHQQLEALGYME
jgi:arylsulfatase